MIRVSGERARIAAPMRLSPHRWPWLWLLVVAALGVALVLSRVRARRRAGRSALRVEGRKDPGAQSVRMERRPRRAAAGRLEIHLTDLLEFENFEDLAGRFLESPPPRARRASLQPEP